MNLVWRWRDGWTGKAPLVGYTLASASPTARRVRVERVLGPGASALVDAGITLAGLTRLAYWADRRVRVERGAAGTSEVQVLSIIGGVPTMGFFTLTYGAGSSDPIAFDAPASSVAAAIAQASSIGVGNVSATGGPLPSTPVTLTFAASLGNVPSPSLGSSTLDDGTTSVTTSVEGSAGVGSDPVVLNCGVPLLWESAQSALLACPLTADAPQLTLTNLDASGNARCVILAYYGA